MKSLGELPVLTAKGGTGIGTDIFMQDADVLKVTFDSANSGSGTVKFQTSDSETLPDFAAAQSLTNRWDYTEVIDNEDGAAIDGDTGVVLTGTDDHRSFSLNVDGAKWFNARVTARAAGDFTVKVRLFATSS